MIKALPTQSKIVLLACIYSLNTGTKCTVSTMCNVYKMLCAAIDVDFLTQRRVIDLTNELDQMGIVISTLEYKGGHGRNRIVKKISSIPALLESPHICDNIYADKNCRILEFLCIVLKIRLHKFTKKICWAVKHYNNWH